MLKPKDKYLIKIRVTDWRNWVLGCFMAAVMSACQVDIPPAPSSPKTGEIKTQQPKPESRVQWRNLLGWNDDCEQSFGSTQARDYSGIESYALANADQLVIVMCAVGGYQPSFLLYRLKQQVPSLLALETYIATDGQTLHRTNETEFWGEPVFRADTQELVILNAARQTKDCGTWAKYSFKPEPIKLVEFRANLPCPVEMTESTKPVPSIPPETWKLVDGR